MHILKIEFLLAKMTLLELYKGYSKRQGIYIKPERKIKLIFVLIQYRSFCGPVFYISLEVRIPELEKGFYYSKDHGIMG